MGSLVGNSEQLDQDSAQLGKREVGNKYAVHCTQTGHSKNKCTVAVENNDDVYGLALRVATDNDVNGLALGVATDNDVNGQEWKGVVQEDKGLSINDIPGLKYCPGGEQPRHTFVGYKPSTSAKREKNFGSAAGA